MIDLKSHVHTVPDFPQPGVLFRDIAPLLRTHFRATIDAMSALLTAEEWQSLDAVAAVDARGFVLGAALAERHGKGVVLIRKRGKLPPPLVSAAYQLEYGESALEMQQGQGRLLLVDDVLATGGTLRAAADLCTQAGYEIAHLAVLIDLKIISDFRWREHRVKSAICY